MTQYQAMLLDNHYKKLSHFPATLLLIFFEALDHNCVEIQVYSRRNDLKSEPLANSEETWLTNGSSFITHCC